MNEQCTVVFLYSYLEIYNERVFDLLKDRKHQNLKIREHPKEGPCVLGTLVMTLAVGDVWYGSVLIGLK